jgi:hypothetical protein
MILEDPHNHISMIHSIPLGVDRVPYHSTIRFLRVFIELIHKLLHYFRVSPDRQIAIYFSILIIKY